MTTTRTMINEIIEERKAEAAERTRAELAEHYNTVHEYLSGWTCSRDRDGVVFRFDRAHPDVAERLKYAMIWTNNLFYFTGVIKDGVGIDEVAGLLTEWGVKPGHLDAMPWVA